MRVALVSDTHGISDPKLLGLFQGCALILHAGDIVTGPILHTLGQVAEVVAVRGNNDHGPDLGRLPEHVVLPVEGVRVLVVHDVGAHGRPVPAVRRLLARERPDVVVHGHSHKPGAAVHDGRLYVNPGSAGPRRFSLPRAAAVMTVDGRRVEVRFHLLAPGRPAPPDDPFHATL